MCTSHYAFLNGPDIHLDIVMEAVSDNVGTWGYNKKRILKLIFEVSKRNMGLHNRISTYIVVMPLS